MNESGYISHPTCFNSSDEYRGWRESARQSREHCTPCDDCTANYMSLMKAADRCKSEYVKAHYVMFPNKGKAKVFA